MKIKRIPDADAQDRFWRYVDKTDDCWLWTGAIVKGYGQFTLRAGKTVRAHRQAYEWLVGPIPDGLTLDHLCRVRRCCRPDHLEPCTRGENVLRGEGPSAQNARATHCGKGHELGGDNVIKRSGKRAHQRECRECALERRRASYDPRPKQGPTKCSRCGTESQPYKAGSSWCAECSKAYYREAQRAYRQRQREAK